MSDPANHPVHVAFLVEQCWHTVPGGTAVASVGLAAALADLSDVTVTGIAARHPRPPADGPVPPVPVVHSRLPRLALYEAWHRTGRPRVENMGTDPGFSLVHASGGAVPATHLPLVATIHDLGWRHEPGHSTKRGRRLFEAWLDDARRAAHVICPSQATRSDLLAAGFEPDRVSVIPLGADPVAVDPGAAAALRSHYGLDGPFVLWVGTTEPRKNLVRLVSAMKQIPDIPLVLVGPAGWKEDAARVTAPLGERARIVGRVDEATKHAWYAAADVFAMPSLLEGFGLPVLEAMGHATPVVTSAGTATEEVVGDAGDTVDPTDADAIAGAISGLLADPDEATRLGEAGRERAVTMTWAAAATATADVYRRVLAK
ncbi:MAG: glycosyltransferase family 1 protein [Acidimicrobiales bacterium]|nr:glycosyltransferase family 4 protein [Actinomycetes bacterium]MDP7353234.1 glycosyltransferase family 1 protein [Acidimicrobiales bacterium]